MMRGVASRAERASGCEALDSFGSPPFHLEDGFRTESERRRQSKTACRPHGAERRGIRACRGGARARRTVGSHLFGQMTVGSMASTVSPRWPPGARGGAFAGALAGVGPFVFELELAKTLALD